MTAGYVIGIDWGGTRIKWGAFDPTGDFLQCGILDYNSQAAITVNVERLMTELENCIRELGARPEGIGLALTGVVNREVGVVLLPGKVRGLEGYNLVRVMHGRFGVPVVADNDGRAALLAECKFGAARGKDWVVMVTLGTGVGSGVLLDGRVLRDPHLQFGTQLGHLVIDASNDQLCLTGARGTGEMLCSATALTLAVLSGLQRGIPSTLSDLYARDSHAVDFRAIIEVGVAAGDRLCLDELTRWTRSLGWLLVNAVHSYSPQLIVLGGGALLGAAHFLPALQEHLDSHIFRFPRLDSVPIAVSPICEHGGVLGAGLLVRESLARKLVS